MYFDGMSMAQNPNAALLMNNNVLDLSYREPAGTMTLRAKLEGETLVGPMTMTKIERGTLQPPITLNLRGTRLTAAPNGCELKAVIPSAQTRERGSSIADGLSNLSKLYSEGLLNDEEFSAAKRRLLGL
ncbi:SHOCT domain-containing protein [Gammaproteobacteria bacterium]|nr:SHOCT domain-containing protein [Gammaproteobacteria bacterium]